jgi:hypothetical protein
MSDNIKNKVDSLKTDTTALDKTLQRFDLDEQLEQEFNAIDKAFRDLEIKYLALQHSRKYHNA